MQFKDKLKEIRRLREWSQQQFADKLEEKRSTYAEWENGTIPSFDIVVKIAAVSGVSIMDFAATIDENLASKTENPHVTPIKQPTVDFLMGKLEGKDDLLAEKEARRKETEKEKDRYFILIEKWLTDIHINSKQTADHLAEFANEVRVEHRVLMDVSDKIAGQPIGTTRAAARNAEIIVQQEHVGKGKKDHVDAGKTSK